MTLQSSSAIYSLSVQEIVTAFESVLLTTKLLNVGSNDNNNNNQLWNLTDS